MFLVRKGETADSKLSGKFFGFKGLVARHDQQIESRLLTITQKQVFTDLYIEYCVNIRTDFHAGCRFVRMICPVKVDSEFIQKFICPDFPVLPSRHICGRSV